MMAPLGSPRAAHINHGIPAAPPRLRLTGFPDCQGPRGRVAAPRRQARVDSSHGNHANGMTCAAWAFISRAVEWNG